MRLSAHTKRNPRALKEPIDMLLSRIRKTETCWLWTRATNNKGYGMVSPITYGENLAHRAVYVHSGFDLKPTDCLLHTCDNPACVNPEHLWVGTKKENTHDMIRKGRWRGKPSLGRRPALVNLPTI